MERPPPIALPSEITSEVGQVLAGRPRILASFLEQRLILDKVAKPPISNEE